MSRLTHSFLCSVRFLAVWLTVGFTAPTLADQQSILEIKSIDPSSGAVSGTIDTQTWPVDPAGFSFIRPFEAGGHPYVFLLASQSGVARIHRFNHGRLGSLIDSYNLPEGFTSIDFARIGSNTHLFLHNSNTGQVRTYRMTPTGRIESGSRSDTTLRDFKDKDLFSVYQQGGEWYVFGLGTWNGKATVYTVTGEKVANYSWTRGWTHVDHVTILGKTYRLLYKTAGDPHKSRGQRGDQSERLLIEQVAADGSRESILHDGAVGEGWTSVGFMRNSGPPRKRHSVFFYHRASGLYKVLAFNSLNGIGEQRHLGFIGRGWTDVDPIRVGKDTYLLTLNEETVEPFTVVEAEKMALCLDAWAKKQGVGYQLGISQSGRKIYQRAWGQRRLEPSQLAMTVDTRLNIGSVSKMMTTLTVLKLADLGEIDLEAPFADYLSSEDMSQGLHNDMRSVSVYQLLTHTSGKNDESVIGSSDSMLGDTCVPASGLRRDCSAFYSTGQDPALCTNGNCRRAYNNSNTAALRDVIERFSGTRDSDGLVEYTRDLWADDVGLGGMSCQGEDKTFYFSPCVGPGCGRFFNGRRWRQSQFGSGETLNHSGSCSAGGWYASSRQLMGFMNALRYRKVLSPEMTDILLDTTLDDPKTAVGWESPWDAGGVDVLGKNGSVKDSGVGTRSYVTRLPGNADAVFLLNSTATERTTRAVRNAYLYAKEGGSCPSL